MGSEMCIRDRRRIIPAHGDRRQRASTVGRQASKNEKKNVGEHDRLPDNAPKQNDDVALDAPNPIPHEYPRKSVQGVQVARAGERARHGGRARRKPRE